MDAPERIRLVRIIEKMEQNKEFSRKIGMADNSAFRDAPKRRRISTL